MDFLKNNWVAILTLAIALTGGIPGIISIIKQFRNRPTFEFDLATYTTGLAEIKGRPILEGDPMLILTGTVSNKGDKSLTPSRFELKARIKNKTITFRNELIPEHLTLHSEIQDIEMKEPWRHDLQRFKGSISTGEPVYGHLLFLTNQIKLEALNSSIDVKDISLELICVDVFRKHHKFPIPPETFHSLHGYRGKYPKHEVYIKPKNSQN